jgi:hypothetical protein
MVTRLLTRRLRLLFPLFVVLLVVFAPAIHFSDHSLAPGFASADEGEGGDGDEGEDEENEPEDRADNDNDDNGKGNCEHGENGEDKGKGKKKGHQKCDDVEVNPVPLAQLYLVAVACQFQGDANLTTCLFVGGTEHGTGDVTRLSVPEEMACTEVTGGQFASVSEEGLGQALSSTDGSPTVTLIFAGRVRTSGEATYRVTTPNGQFPAKGPGLQCGETSNVAAPTDMSATAGAVRVIANDCPAGVDPQSADWYATCATASSGVTFRLLENGVSSDSAKTGATDESGNLSFDNLPAGTYHLLEDDGNWCHAESDSVDANGDVVVRNNERSTVWIFHCPPAVSS